MDAIGPHVHILLVRKIPLAPVIVFVTLLFFYATDDVGTQPRGPFTYERLKGLGEVSRRDALEVEPRDQLLDCVGLSQVGRQDAGGERHPFFWIGMVVTDAALSNGNRSGPR